MTEGTWQGPSAVPLGAAERAGTAGNLPSDAHLSTQTIEPNGTLS